MQVLVGTEPPSLFLKSISKHTSPLGNFGEFVFGTEQEKGEDGKYVITEKGTNLGEKFEFIVVNVCYRYKMYDEVKEKTHRSNIFGTLDGIKTAVDVYTGKALPSTKEEKKAADWKLVRINGGLVRKNSKAAWTPVIWETHGAMYFGLNQLLEGTPNQGLLSGVAKLSTELLEHGSVLYPAVKKEESSFGAAPKDLFTKAENKEMLADITKKMTDYRKASQFSGAAQAAPAQAEGTASEGAEGNDGDNW